MADISNLTRQHQSIRGYVEQITELINKNNIEEDANEIAKGINTLAGRLKIHLQSEDEHLYPKLLTSENKEIKRIAETYIKDMGNINTVFEKYKNQFNTKSKICFDIECFKQESKVVFSVLKKRLDQEDNNLYPLIQN